MTSNERVDEIIQQYLRYLEGEASPPSLEGLTAAEKRLAHRIMRGMDVARGMDAEASPPSLERLLVGTEFFDQLHAEATDAIEEDAIRQALAEVPTPCRVDPDHMAQAVGVRSDFVIRVGGHRLRVQIRDDLTAPEELRKPQTILGAAAIFGAFSEVTGVVVALPDSELSAIVVDPFESQYCIEAPSGILRAPEARRPVLPLGQAVRSYLEEIAPPFDPIPSFDQRADEFDLGFDAWSLARETIANIVVSGSRARIEAKRVAWTALGERETEVIAGLLSDSTSGGLDAESLEDRVLEAAGTSP